HWILSTILSTIRT
ncbi:unnamed protein product, partial [Rotaria sp. Silwood1]